MVAKHKKAVEALPRVIKGLADIIPSDAEMADHALDMCDRFSAQRDEALKRVKELEAQIVALRDQPRGHESHFVDVARERLSPAVFKTFMETAKRRAL